MQLSDKTYPFYMKPEQWMDCYQLILEDFHFQKKKMNSQLKYETIFWMI